MQYEEETGYKNCLQCTAVITVESRFCKNCGKVQLADDGISSTSKWITMQQAMLFYGIELLICCMGLLNVFKTVSFFLTANGLLALNKLTFFIYSWSANRSVLRWPNFSFQKLCAYCAVALTGSLLVHYSVTWLNQTIFDKDEYYDLLLPGNKFEGILIILFTAVFPAVFEELGFRGYLLGSLLKVADTQQAVFISAFLFAIIHLSFISLFWLIPFGLFLGYTRVKEGTIWYGVFFHFSFNFCACLFELF